MGGSHAKVSLRLDDVGFRYRHGREGFALQNVSLEMRQGETVVLMGHNGSGKTTVLRIAAGLVRPSTGSVHVDLDGTPRGITAPQREIGYIPQQLGLLRNRSVLDNVLLGCLGRVGTLASVAARFPPEELEHALAWIERVGLAAKRDHRVYRLSGGERQRVAVARALMQHPRILLADEFVSSLDPRRAREILELARERLKADGVSALFALHNLALAQRFADRIVFLKHGTVAADLTAAEVTEEVAERHLTA